MEHGPDAPYFSIWTDYLGLQTFLKNTLLQSSQDDFPRQVELPEPCPGTIREEPGHKVFSGPPKKIPDRFHCTFCKHNGEHSRVYTGHNLRDRHGTVLCPVLRSYTCPQCGATGDKAHTKRFCPMTQKNYTSVYRTAASTKPPKRH
ncbi:nanos homolog 3 [Mantella aurantiaca]